MKNFKTLLDIVGFTSLFLILGSMGLFFYGVAYELPKSHYLYSVFIPLSLYGIIVGLIWAFFICIWIYLDDKNKIY